MLQYDCIVIGGSYAGLSAALSLGRASCRTLVIDDGKPINSSAEKLHNLLGWDGMDPRRLQESGTRELSKYDTVNIQKGLVTSIEKADNHFVVEVSGTEKISAAYILLATGLQPVFPEISDFDKCWGKSIFHCPYCHGYEFRNESTAVLGDGDAAFDMTRLLLMWTKNIVVFTNGGKLSKSQINKLNESGIKIEDEKINSLVHKDGVLQAIVLDDNRSFIVKALYHQPTLMQTNELAKNIGCRITREGLIETDVFQSTSIKGIYAAGDNSSNGHSVASAIANGSVAGIFISKALAGL